jgi:hypothetical protein
VQAESLSIQKVAPGILPVQAESLSIQKVVPGILPVQAGSLRYFFPD